MKQKIFISYASGESKEHKDDVISFTNYLRQLGFRAISDTTEMGENTAIHFPEMMVRNIQEADKVIIILSKTYKNKADNFKGGVGFEYRDIISEIDQNKNKYIIAVFQRPEMINEEFIKEVAPKHLSKRQVISLFNTDELLRKLTDTPQYSFDKIADTIPRVKSAPIEPFKGRLRDKNDEILNAYDFENLFIHTRYTFESKSKISYEVFRTIRVRSERLTELEIKPDFKCNSMVQVSSKFFSKKEIMMDNNNVLRFNYPIPKDNKKGDIITIHYKAEFQDKFEESEPQWEYKSVNDSMFELHEIILLYKKNNKNAIMTKLDQRKNSVDYDFRFEREIEFDTKRKSYRFVLINPEKNFLRKVKWDK